MGVQHDASSNLIQVQRRVPMTGAVRGDFVRGLAVQIRPLSDAWRYRGLAATRGPHAPSSPRHNIGVGMVETVSTRRGHLASHHSRSRGITSFTSPALRACRRTCSTRTRALPSNPWLRPSTGPVLFDYWCSRHCLPLSTGRLTHCCHRVNLCLDAILA